MQFPIRYVLLSIPFTQYTECEGYQSHRSDVVSRTELLKASVLAARVERLDAVTALKVKKDRQYAFLEQQLSLPQL